MPKVKAKTSVQKTLKTAAQAKVSTKKSAAEKPKPPVLASKPKPQIQAPSRLEAEIAELLQLIGQNSSLDFLKTRLAEKAREKVKPLELLSFYRLIAQTLSGEINRKDSHINYLAALAKRQKETISQELSKLKSELVEKEKRSIDYARLVEKIKLDFDAFKSRTNHFHEQNKDRSNEQLVLKLLPVLDNFGRALQVEVNSNNGEAFFQGVKMIYQQMENLLHKEGLAPIKAVGEKFNPHLHEVALESSNSELPEDTILEELQRGYYYKNKVIRAAKIRISAAQT